MSTSATRTDFVSRAQTYRAVRDGRGGVTLQERSVAVLTPSATNRAAQISAAADTAKRGGDVMGYRMAALERDKFDKAVYRDMVRLGIHGR